MNKMSVAQNEIRLDMENVTWKKEGTPILEQINWKIRRGEHWVLLGLNGSGKTSLLNLLLGYEWPSSGKVSVLDNAFGQTNMQELRQRVGMVSTSLLERFQKYPNMTVKEVVLSGPYASIGLYQKVEMKEYEKAMGILQQFEMETFADYPFHLLSQGQKVRVMLARAWMTDPSLLILDEPCSGLDVRMREHLLMTVEEMMNQPNSPTILYVTHHLEEIVPAFTHVLLLKDGKAVHAGDKHEVLQERNLEIAFELPVKIHWEEDRPWISVKNSGGMG